MIRSYTYPDLKTGVINVYIVKDTKPTTWTYWIGNRRILMRNGEVISDETFPEGEASSLNDIV
jgi:hypothetical protein